MSGEQIMQAGTARANADTGLPWDVATLVFLRERGIVVLWVVLLVAFSIWNHPWFATLDNAMLILSAASLTAIFAAAVAVGVISGMLDLSLPGVAALSSVVAAQILLAGGPVWLALLIAIAVGLLCGLINALITLRGLNPLVVTIGTLSVTSGVAAVVAGGYSLPGLTMLHFMGPTQYFGVPVHALIMMAVYLGLTLFLTRTRHGLRLVAVGSNPEAVRRVGLSDTRYKVLGFVLSGGLSALGGVMTAALISEASPAASPAIIFEALTAVALAGVSLKGGRGSLPKVFVGALVLATISDALTIAGVQPYWATVSTGVLMIGALLGDKLLTETISHRLVKVSTLSVHSGRSK
jgi:ribose transport system permease protein